MENLIGKPFSSNDLSDLKESLLVIAEEEGASYALELLRYGYKRTTMTRQEFDSLYREIIRQ